MLKLGICTDIENAAALKRAGFDYLELGFSKAASLSDEAFDALLEKVRTAPLPVEAMNSMLPGDFVLCSEEGTGEKIRAFLEKGFTRAEAMGVKIVVFGAGGARRLPEGMPEEEGYDYLEKYLRMAGPLAEKHGIRVAIEPLRAAECNILNYVREAKALEEKVGLPSVGSLADLYHMMCGNDNYKDVEKGVIHCHIADRKSRAYPKKGDGSEADYEAFFNALKKSGYEGRVSIEGGAPADFEAGIKESFLLLDGLRRKSL